MVGSQRIEYDAEASEQIDLTHRDETRPRSVPRSGVSAPSTGAMACLKIDADWAHDPR